MEKDDYIYYTQGYQVMSCGMTVESILLKNKIQPLHTLQCKENNLVVPVGLLYLLNHNSERKPPKFEKKCIDNDLYENILNNYIDSTNHKKYQRKSSTKKKKLKGKYKTLKSN